MAGRPISNVPNNFTSEGTGTLNNIPLLDANFNYLVSQFNDSSIGFSYGTDTGAINNYVVSLTAAPSAYAAGMILAVLIANSNSASSTINVNSLGAQTIKNAAGSVLTGGELPASTVVVMVYDGTAFRIVGLQYTAVVSTFTSATSQAVACDGSETVNVVYTFSAAGTVTVTLNRLRQGVPINFAAIPFSSGTSVVNIAATNPAGTSLSTVIVQQGVSGVQTSLSLTTGHTAIGNGAVIGTSLYLSFTVS